ncbi:hypothetical protein P9869_06520 [Streptomyces ossamyceticus]|nr:hypothetical protein [Streptomyces ossamyceticus]
MSDTSKAHRIAYVEVNEHSHFSSERPVLRGLAASGGAPARPRGWPPVGTDADDSDRPCPAG